MQDIYFRSKYFIFFVSLGAAVAAFTVSAFLPPVYEATVTFSVLKKQVSEMVDYQYDDYYAFQSEELYGKTIMSWFSSPPQLRRLAATANVAVGDAQLSAWARQFTIKQAAAQNIVVQYKDKEEASAVAIGDALASFVEQEVIGQLSLAGKQDAFVVTGSPSILVEKETAWWLITAIGFALGFIASVMIVGLRAFMRDEEGEVIAQEKIDIYTEE